MEAVPVRVPNYFLGAPAAAVAAQTIEVVCAPFQGANTVFLKGSDGLVVQVHYVGKIGKGDEPVMWLQQSDAARLLADKAVSLPAVEGYYTWFGLEATHAGLVSITSQSDVDNWKKRNELTFKMVAYKGDTGIPFLTCIVNRAFVERPFRVHMSELYDTPDKRVKEFGEDSIWLRKTAEARSFLALIDKLSKEAEEHARAEWKTPEVIEPSEGTLARAHTPVSGGYDRHVYVRNFGNYAPHGFGHDGGPEVTSRPGTPMPGTPRAGGSGDFYVGNETGGGSWTEGEGSGSSGQSYTSETYGSNTRYGISLRANAGSTPYTYRYESV